MLSSCTTSLVLLASSFLSTCIAQDGFTWWVNPNSTDPVTFQEGQTVTLQWVTDFPKFNIVLYQNLGENYGDFASAYLLEEASGISSYDWIVAPIQDNTMTGNLSFHLDLTLAGNDENGANSQEFLIIPSANGSTPTGYYPTDSYPTDAYPTDSYGYSSGAATTVYEPSTITDVPGVTKIETTTSSAALHIVTAAGGTVTVSTRSYSSTVLAQQQTGTQTATTSGPTVSAFKGAGARLSKSWVVAAIAAFGGVVAAL